MRLTRKRKLTMAAVAALSTLTALTAPIVAPDTAAADAPCDYPAQQLNLTNWKETLPTGPSGSPTEIKQPALATYSSAPWFNVNARCTGVQFRSPVNGVTTPNSSYARSELREMTDNGTERASWSATSGTHTLTFREAFNKLPNTKPHVVGAQIHGSDDDITAFRLEGSNLYITKGNDTHHKLVTSDYKLHTVFEGKYVVSNGKIKVYYNGVLQTTISHTGSGNYFKVGAYTQANCGNSSPCSSSNYGQVSVYALKVTHS
ncbi:polysaccharide lyase family 7 protein [Nocardiopsis sp. CNT312]|uniref:polysaccharide lyase family 7 protein n=1 Tax=Nocardiopsis sp. CNT312 TaxID=1137268 RepID=UPI00048CF12F|nr:polysaccharide lyase family 7 protein [Nocardiopsis sp. CNT312]